MQEKRIEILDILRAFALLLICVYHWVGYKGTYIGVVIFFVLSGYLFTSKYFNKPKSLIEILKFRISKLYPSLLFIILITTLILFFLNGGKGLEQIYKNSVIFSILPLNNIFQILSKLSYFDNYIIMMPLTHLWALSFQFQMYVIGGIILIILNKVKFQREMVILFFSFISFISALAMWIYFNTGWDYSRIYYGTETRAFSFFIAGAFGAYYGNKVIKKKWERILINLMGILGIFSIILYIFYIDYKNPLNYNGLMYLESVLLSFTMVMFSKRKLKFLNNFLVRKILNPIIRLGQHQYEYYLWQYPVMIIFNELFKFSLLDYNIQFLLQLIVLIFLSELTYYIFNRSIIGTGLSYISFGMLIGILIVAPNYFNSDLETMKKIQKEKNNIENKVEEIEDKDVDFKVKNDVDVKDNNNIENQNNSASYARIDDRKILIIGDSVMEMSRDMLNRTYPRAVIDNKVGRQFSDLKQLLKMYKDKGQINGTVIISLGSNGRIYSEDMKQVIEILKGNNVYLVNVVTNKLWEKSVNNLINKTVNENENFYLIDWNGFSKGKKELFYSDGIHLREKYSKYYVDLIYNEVIKR